MIDTALRPGWAHLKAEITRSLRPGLELEVWDETRLAQLVRELFDAELPSVDVEPLLSVRQAIDRAKGFHAFGGDARDSYENDPLRARLLWHLRIPAPAPAGEHRRRCARRAAAAAVPLGCGAGRRPVLVLDVRARHAR